MPRHVPAIPGEPTGWPMTLATRTLSVTWWALKTLSLLGSLAAVSFYAIDWQDLVIQPILQEISSFANQFIDGIDAETVKSYADTLVDALEAQVGHANNLPSVVSNWRWYFTIGESIASVVVGMGSEWWIARKKDFSFTRGFIYSMGAFGALKAVELDAYVTVAVYGAEAAVNLDFDWDDIKKKVRKIIDDKMGAHGL
jgi:hypothetical protein